MLKTSDCVSGGGERESPGAAQQQVCRWRQRSCAEPAGVFAGSVMGRAQDYELGEAEARSWRRSGGGLLNVKAAPILCVCAWDRG